MGIKTKTMVKKSLKKLSATRIGRTQRYSFLKIQISHMGNRKWNLFKKNSRLPLK